jgi:hypothetical protein
MLLHLKEGKSKNGMSNGSQIWFLVVMAIDMNVKI